MKRHDGNGNVQITSDSYGDSVETYETEAKGNWIVCRAGVK